MQSKATTPEQYLAELPEDRKEPMSRLRETIRQHLPAGFQETISYGMIGYVVPHSSYPEGYHCDPDKPLPFINIASQKNFIALYHMGIYNDPELLAWFKAEYPKYVPTKLDMGKSCIRFKNNKHIPYPLIADLVSRITPGQWVERYESAIKNR